MMSRYPLWHAPDELPASKRGRSRPDEGSWWEAQRRRSTPPSRSQAQRQQFRDARRFQERVQEELAGLGTFTEWLVLEMTHELIEEADDAVSQADVARRTGLSERVISFWMLRMSLSGLVDRAPTADGRAWRVLLTSSGQQRRKECNLRLEAAKLTD